VSWTHALRQIVTNCYKFHGREDLLPQFNEDEDGEVKSEVKSPQQQPRPQPSATPSRQTATVVSLFVHFFLGGGVSNPLCLFSCSAVHFFPLFFLDPPPC
jgi:hypothetical protein